MNILEIKELPFSSKARIWWGFFWRGIAVTLGSSLCGALLGGIAGFTLALIGFPKEAITIAGGVLGGICGILFFYFYIRWLLAARIGNYRLALVHAQEAI